MKPIDNILEAFSAYMSNLKILPSYKKLKCIRCGNNGSLLLSSGVEGALYCNDCYHYLHVTHLCDVAANKYKTILMEKSFNLSF